MESNQQIKEIEQYLDGSLSERDLEVFQQRLLEDKILASRVNLMKQINFSLTDDKAIAVQNAVMDLGDEFFKIERSTESKTKTHRLPFYRQPLAIAASFLVILLFSFAIWWQMTAKPISSQALYATYYTPYQANDAVRGENVDDSLYKQALDQYNGGDFLASISTFQKHLALNPTDIQAMYCMAHAHLNGSVPNYSAAITQFEKIIEDGKSIKMSKAQWYLALIYLKQDKIEHTKKLLEDLKRSQDDKMAKQAEGLLKQLD